MMRRPPKRSVQMPSGRRNSAPVSTGVAVSNPNCVESSPISARIGMPVTPNIIHTAKQTVNASVLANSTLTSPAGDIRSSTARPPDNGIRSLFVASAQHKANFRFLAPAQGQPASIVRQARPPCHLLGLVLRALAWVVPGAGAAKQHGGVLDHEEDEGEDEGDAAGIEQYGISGGNGLGERPQHGGGEQAAIGERGSRRG